MPQRRPDNFRDRLPVRAAAVLFWLLVWEAASLSLHSDLLLVSPLRAVTRLAELSREPVFLQSVLGSFTKIGLGYLLGLAAGTFLAVLAARFRPVRDLLAPAVLAVKSVPVASFIILALVWFSSRRLSVVIPLLMVFPTVYTGVLEGCLQIDRRLEEMADVFTIPYSRRLRYLRAPQIYPYFESASRLGLGLAWKSGIAAEVIGMPAGTIGERLQKAKTYLDTPDLFAWTLAIVFLSFLSEFVFVHALRLAFRLLMRMPAQAAAGSPAHSPSGSVPAPSVTVSHISKHFGDTPVLSDFSAAFRGGRITCLLGPSGIGKTTLLRILAGLETADGGEITPGPAGSVSGDSVVSGGNFLPAMVFQEDRLLSDLSVLQNLRLTTPSLSEETAMEALAALGLSHDLLHHPVRTLSGGMQRRVALLRALLSGRRLLLLDEPFTGLDDDTRTQVLRGLQEMAAGSTVILVTHAPGDAEILQADVLELPVVEKTFV